MTMNLHTQTSAPNPAPATSVSPLEHSGSSKTKFFKGKTKPDIYQVVTDSIIEALEMGGKPWVCPWKRNGAVSGIPSNFTTGTAYSGMNIMLLWCSAAKQGFNDSRWLTYKQAQEQGAKVRKGEHGTTGWCALYPRPLGRGYKAHQVKNDFFLKLIEYPHFNQHLCSLNFMDDQIWNTRPPPSGNSTVRLSFPPIASI